MHHDKWSNGRGEDGIYPSVLRKSIMKSESEFEFFCISKIKLVGYLNQS